MIYDVCVIGGGPASIFSSYYASSRSLKTVLVEANSLLGGRLHYYLQMPIYDVPGAFGIQAEHLLNQYIAQLNKSDTTIILEHSVQKVKKVETCFIVETCKGILKAKAVIVAVGNGIIKNKSFITTIANEETLNQIRYEVKKDDFNKYKSVAIIGHTPTAVDWAIQFVEKGVSTILYETKSLKLQPILMDQVSNLSIHRVPVETVKEMRTEYGEFLIDGHHVQAVFAHVGTTKQTIRFSEPLVSLDNGRTTIQGVFIAGDARNEYRKLKLIHGATHDAMQAVNEANQYLNEHDFYQPIVSTHHPIFKEWNK